MRLRWWKNTFEEVLAPTNYTRTLREQRELFPFSMPAMNWIPTSKKTGSTVQAMRFRVGLNAVTSITPALAPPR